MKIMYIIYIALKLCISVTLELPVTATEGKQELGSIFFAQPMMDPA